MIILTLINNIICYSYLNVQLKPLVFSFLFVLLNFLNNFSIVNKTAICMINYVCVYIIVRRTMYGVFKSNKTHIKEKHEYR